MFKCLNNKGFTPLEIQGSLSLSKDLKAKPPNGSALSNTKINGKFLTGFTLVEMLVAISIFVIVVTIISGLFVHAIQGQRRNLAYQELLDQTSYVMEYMSRSIRMAMKDDIAVWDYGDKSCLPGDDGLNYATSTVGNLSCLRFRNYKDECQYFCLDADEKKLVTATTADEAAIPTFTDLTSQGLEVSSLGTQWVRLSGERDDSGSQPLVYINLQAEGRERIILRIQTSISQRNLNNQKLP